MSNSMPTVILTGGGTGGHITPLLAVASELKKLRPDIRIVYIGQKGGVLGDVTESHPAIDEVYAVRAGKFRRFKSEGWRQVFDLPMQLKNLVDAWWVLVGLWQSYWLIHKLRPGIIFTRGGYVSVPVALGGRLNGVPYVTHDSDSTPSLANRILARWAAKHAVAMEPRLYPYRENTTVLTGIPVAREYERVTPNLQHSYRKEAGLQDYKSVLFVTGGGNGAETLNKLVALSAGPLLERYPALAIVHTAGRLHEASLSQLYDELLTDSQRKRVFVAGFLSDMYRYTGAADVIIARAGATTLAEVAIQGKACIVIPASQLSWQLHQARTLADKQAVIDLPQAEAVAHDSRLAEVVSDLLDHAAKRQALERRISALAIPDAAHRIAVVLLDQMR